MIETLLFLPDSARHSRSYRAEQSAEHHRDDGLCRRRSWPSPSCCICSPASFTPYFRIDDLNILFLLVLAVVFFGVAIFNIDFLRKNEAPAKSQALFTANLLIFVASMTGVILSTHLALLWVFVEATTLSSSYLIFFSHSEASLEATWKYLFICSIGIAIAFVGIIFLSMGLGRFRFPLFRRPLRGREEHQPLLAEARISLHACRVRHQGRFRARCTPGSPTRIRSHPRRFRRSFPGRFSTRRSWASCGSTRS